MQQLSWRDQIQLKMKIWSFEQLYNHYDKDGNEQLSAKEVAGFFTSLLHKIGINITVHSWQAKLALKLVDKNDDSNLNKHQAYCCFNWLLGKITGEEKPTDGIYPEQNIQWEQQKGKFGYGSNQQAEGTKGWGGQGQGNQQQKWGDQQQGWRDQQQGGGGWGS